MAQSTHYAKSVFEHIFVTLRHHLFGVKAFVD